MTEETAQPEAPKKKRGESKVKCEILRKIFIDDPEGRIPHAIPIAPNELTVDEQIDNAKRKKAGRTDLIVPDPVFYDLPKPIAKKFQECGAIKVAL